MLKYNQTVSMHLGSKLSRIVPINRSLSRFVSFLFCLRRGVLCLSIVASTFLLSISIEFNSDSFGLRTIIIKENYNVSAHAGEHRKFIDRRPIAPCRFYIYIASLLNRHGISCNPCHAVKARHCLVCHAAPRVMVPDSRGCGSEMNLGTKHHLIVRNCDG